MLYFLLHAEMLEYKYIRYVSCWSELCFGVFFLIGISDKYFIHKLIRYRPTKLSCLLTTVSWLIFSLIGKWGCFGDNLEFLQSILLFFFLRLLNLNLWPNFVLYTKQKTNRKITTPTPYTTLCMPKWMPRAKKGQKKFNFEKRRECFVGLFSF